MAVGIPIEDNYEATLTQALAASASALTIYVSRTPVATFPANTEVVMTINPKKGFTRQENVLVESYDATAKTLTIKTASRAQTRYAGDSPSPLAHSVGSKIIISDAYPVWNSLDDGLPISGGTMTGQLNFSGTTHAGIKHINLTTAQRDALTPSNGMMIYNITTGEHNQVIGGSWTPVAAGSTQADASTTVAGKVEEATNAEVKAGTAAGGTGARLFINPASTVVTSSGAADDGLIPKLNTSGQLATGFIDFASGTVPQSISSLPAGEAVDGTTTPQLVAMSDGTNSKTSGRFYKADADDFTNMLANPIGLVAVNAATPGTSYNVIIGGVVGGFTGLTVGVPYYMDTTAGGITSTVPTSAVVFMVGRAISTTQILLDLKALKSIYATYSFTVSTATTVDTTISLGFSPIMVFAGLNAQTANTRGSIGMWMKNGASFSLENKNTGPDTNGTGSPTMYRGQASTSLLYYSGIDNSVPSPANYVNQTFSVLSNTAQTITIRRVSTIVGSPSDANVVYLHILGY